MKLRVQYLHGLYSKEIEKILNSGLNYIPVFSPNIVVSSNGNNCGDKLSYKIRIIGDIFFLEPIIQCCSLAVASLIVLMNEICNKNIYEIIRICDEVKKEFEQFYVRGKNFQSPYLRIFSNDDNLRLECIELPWNLLYIALEEILKQMMSTSVEIKPGTKSLLGCDSCITSSVIQTVNQRRIIKEQASFKHRLIQTLKRQSVLNPLEKQLFRICKCNWFEFGKLFLNDKDVRGLFCLLRSWEDVYFTSLFRNYSLQLSLASHLKNYFPKSSPKIIFDYLKKRDEFFIKSEEEWVKIDEELKRRNVKYCIVKGYATKKYYTNYIKRNYMDIDIITPDIYSFFEVASILKYIFEFEYFDKLGQAGSLFLSKDFVLSGHAHLVKNLQINEHMIIDISFPNLPINDRVLSIDLNNGITSNYESDLFLVSLAHAFKHSRPPINEINDGFHLIYSNKMNWGYLYDKIYKNELQKHNYLMYLSLKKYYTVTDEYAKMCKKMRNSIIFRFFSFVLLTMNWPFSRKAHGILLLYFKLIDGVKKRRKRSDNGMHLSLSYFMDFMLRSNNNRTYFIPLISFDTIPDEDFFERIKNKKDILLEIICQNVYFVQMSKNAFIICNNGIMAFTKSFHMLEEEMETLNKECFDLVNMLCIKSDSYHKRIIFNTISGMWEFL